MLNDIVFSIVYLFIQLPFDNYNNVWWTNSYWHIPVHKIRRRYMTYGTSLVTYVGANESAMYNNWALTNPRNSDETQCFWRRSRFVLLNIKDLLISIVIQIIKQCRMLILYGGKLFNIFSCYFNYLKVF